MSGDRKKPYLGYNIGDILGEKPEGSNPSSGSKERPSLPLSGSNSSEFVERLLRKYDFLDD